MTQEAGFVTRAKVFALIAVICLWGVTDHDTILTRSASLNITPRSAGVERLMQSLPPSLMCWMTCCVSARRCCVPATPQNQASEGNKDQVNSWRADYTL